jgi:FKBP-type peptidyl-prolyl cis-trans isomerase (trigger factor)
MSYTTKIKKLPKAEVEMEISLPAEFLADARQKAIKLFSDAAEISGFRKGRAPENIVIEKAGEDKILNEAVDILLREHFSKVIDQEKLDIIGRPKISITKLALGNPVEFKASFAVMPDFELPDFKKIAKEVGEKEKKEDTEASEKEINEVLLQIRKNKAHFDYHKNHPEEKEHDHQQIDLEKEENLPQLNDELAKEAGDFKNLDELRAKVKENIISEKKMRNIEKKRAAVMEELLKNTKIDMPEILIENEIEKSLAQMKGDIERMGLKFDEYLKQIKKTEEDLKKDSRESSEKKAAVQLIFNKIAETEKIEPNKEILENQVKEVMEHYPDASEMNARIYVATILLNQEVLKLLENQ